MTSVLLGLSLCTVVPLAIDEVAAWTPDQRLAYCHDHADVIASRSDVLMFGGKRGEAAEVFAVLARALACLAYQPGGVVFAGTRWEATPSGWSCRAAL